MLSLNRTGFLCYKSLGCHENSSVCLQYLTFTIAEDKSDDIVVWIAVVGMYWLTCR